MSKPVVTKPVVTKPVVTKTLETTTRWKLSAEEIETVLREYVKAPANADVDFDVGQMLRGATITWKEQSDG